MTWLNTGCDNCPGVFNPWQEDSDGDGIGDACDPCPLSPIDLGGCPPTVVVVNQQQTYDIFDSDDLAATLAELHIYGSAAEGRVGMYVPDETRDTSENTTEKFVRTLRKRHYELKDHLGNVRVVLSDLKRSGVNGINRAPWKPDVLSYSNYYPYGMLQPDRYWKAPSYRDGFKRKEKDDEVHSDAVTGAVAGVGNSYDFGARVYDVRLGRWLSIDPLAQKYPSLSPYVYCANSPLIVDDRGGDSIFLYTTNVAVRAALRALYATEVGRKVMENLATSTTEHVYITDFNLDGAIKPGRAGEKAHAVVLYDLDYRCAVDGNRPLINFTSVQPTDEQDAAESARADKCRMGQSVQMSLGTVRRIRC